MLIIDRRLTAVWVSMVVTAAMSRLAAKHLRPRYTSEEQKLRMAVLNLAHELVNVMKMHTN